MDMASRFGLTVPSMKVNGEKTMQLVMENYSMQMVIYMKDSGLMIKLMVKEVINMQMEPHM